jgi:hypothetical protein
METQPPLEVFRPLELLVPTSRQGFAKGQPFEFGLGNGIVHELGSFGEESKNRTTHTSTPKSMEEVAIEVM